METTKKESFAKTAIENSAMYSVSAFVSRAAAFLMLPVYTRYLSPANYGVLDMVDLSTYIIGSVLVMGLAADGLYYFLARCRSEQERSQLVYTVMALGLTLGLCGGSLLFLNATPIARWIFHKDQYADVVRIAGAFTLFTMPTEIGMSYLCACRLARHFLYFSLARLASGIGLNVLFLAVFGMGLYSILFSTLISTGLQAAGLAVYIVRRLGPVQRPSLAMAKRMAAYSAPLGLGSFGLLFIHYGDRFFLNQYGSLAVVGIYALAYKFGMLLGWLNAPFDTFWRSQMNTVMGSGSADGDRIFSRMFTFVFAIFVLGWYGLAVLGGLAIRTMAEPKYWGAAVFVPWIACAYLAKALIGQLETSLLVAKKTRWVMLSNWTGTAVCAICYPLAIRKLGAWGAVLATNAAFLVMLIITFVAGQCVKPKRLEYRKLVWPPLVLAPLFAIHYSLPLVANKWQQGAIDIGFAVLGVAVVALLPALREERRQLVGTLRRMAEPALAGLFSR